MSSFDEGCDSAQLIDRAALLPAMSHIHAKLAATMPRPTRRLLIRQPSATDIDAEFDPRQHLPLDFDAFEHLSRAVFRRAPLLLPRLPLCGSLSGF